MESRRPSPRRSGRTLLAAVLVLLAASACGGGGPDESEAADSASSGRSAAAPSVRYLTAVAFAASDTSLGLLLELEQTTGPGRLGRSYRGWLGDASGWSVVLALDDTLPVPAAAWRVLPGGSMRVRVAGGGEVSAYRIAAPGGPVTLEIGPAVSAWTSADSARSGLRRALLTTRGDSLPGLALVRRASAPGQGGRPTLDGFLMLALSDSQGIVTDLPAGGRGSVRAHGRLAGRAGPWDSVAVALPGDEAGAVHLPNGTFAVDIAPIAVGDGVPGALVRGRTLEGPGRVVRGLLVPAGGD